MGNFILGVIFGSGFWLALVGMDNGFKEMIQANKAITDCEKTLPRHSKCQVVITAELIK